MGCHFAALCCFSNRPDIIFHHGHVLCPLSGILFLWILPIVAASLPSYLCSNVISYKALSLPFQIATSWHCLSSFLPDFYHETFLCLDYFDFPWHRHQNRSTMRARSFLLFTSVSLPLEECLAHQYPLIAAHGQLILNEGIITKPQLRPYLYLTQDVYQSLCRYKGSMYSLPTKECYSSLLWFVSTFVKGHEFITFWK